VVIGVGDYLHGQRIAPLRYAERDARALCRMLVDPAVCAFPRDNVAVLTHKRARRDRVVHYLSHWLPTRARGADLALIYFAGHGMVQAVGPREEGFLLPYDADPNDVVTRGVAMSDVGRWIDAVGAAAVVVCLDCCHAGKVVLRDPVPTATRDLELRPAVLARIGGKGRFLIASCDQGQKSLEAEELGHGLFTYYLLQGLAGAGDRDRDGQVGVAELFTYVSAAVAQDARDRFGRDQRPWTSATWAGDVCISRPRVRPERPPAPVSVETHGPEEAGEDFERIEEEMAGADEPGLLRILRRLGEKGNPAATPAIFGHLAHPSASVRRQAKRAVHAIGWDRVSAAAEDLARRSEAGAMPAILDGLEAFEAHPDVVGLLDRLTAVLRGEHRNRAILLLERKRLGVELDKVAALFCELQSPYRIEKALGQGLFTAAYLARNEAANLEVVVQVLRPEFARQPHVRAGFLDLAHQSLRFVHHNLVLTREVRAFPDREVYYAVRDYVNGVTLQKLFESGRRFTPQQIFKVVRQILAALTPLHERAVRHGGIKPSNIFIREGDRVLLGDPSPAVAGLGLALERLSYDYRYAPPEMFRSGVAVGPSADFYSLGCVAYELACCQPPFTSDNHLELAALHGREPIVPPAARGSRLGEMGDRYLLRLLAAAPAERFGSLDEALAALDGVEQSLRSQVPPAAGPPRPLVRDESLADYRAGQSVVSFHVSGPSTLGLGAELAQGVQAEPSLPAMLGRYQLVGRIGQGGMGVVYKAFDPQLRRVVAIKLLPPEGFRQSKETVGRFLREVEAVARLRHPNIVPIYDVGTYEGGHYYVMGLVEGGSLSQKLRQQVVAPREAAALIEKIARAVQHAHEHGVVHRDVKPANILLDERGEPQITDFGLAKLLAEPDAAVTQAGTIVGTPAYMSPEQAKGRASEAGPATDLWSLGVTLYELLTGRKPFGGEGSLGVLHQVATAEPPRPRSLRADLDPGLEAICLKCLEKEPAKRYASAGTLADDLARWLRGEPIQARAPGIWQAVQQRLFRRKP
jgi:serine/threonine protein kinase